MDERMRFGIRLKDGESMASLCREFEKTCHENGFVQPLVGQAWFPTARRYMRDPELVVSAKLSSVLRE